MKRTKTLPLAAALLALAALPASVLAAPPPTPSQPPQPPHAWLFGTWTGGIFPTPSGVSAQACLSQPVVIFTRDVVLRATLTSELYAQRVIESARTGPNGAEFRFAQAMPAPSGPLGLGDGPSAQGFGCADGPDVLHVERKTDNEITFPHCADFPYPLIRCPGR